MPKSYYNAGNPGFKGETFREHLEEGGWVGGWRGKGRLIPKPSPRFFNTISLYNSFSKVSIFGNLGGGVLPRLHGYVFLEKNERGCSEAAPRAILCDSQRHLGASRPLQERVCATRKGIWAFRDRSNPLSVGSTWAPKKLK